MSGTRIISADIRRPDLRWPFPDDMATRLTGAVVQRLGRRSKYILVDLDTSETLIIHLGMSGRMTVSGDPLGQFHRQHPAVEKHDHVILDMENGARITFNDPRRFGAMDLCPTADLDTHRLLKNLGPEPHDNGFNADYLGQSLAGKRGPIKSVLLDQRIIAGLGNIYVCEALWRSGISPKRVAGQISKPRIENLTNAIRAVISDAIAAGGSSLKDYRQADGELGYFQHSFAVYDREAAPCQTPECTGAIKRITQSGRSSFYCSKCQR